MNFDGSYIFVRQELSSSSLFDELPHDWRVVHFEQNITQITIYQVLSHGQVKLKAYWISWDKYRFRVTPLARNTWAEASLSARLTYLPQLFRSVLPLNAVVPRSEPRCSAIEFWITVFFRFHKNSKVNKYIFLNFVGFLLPPSGPVIYVHVVSFFGSNLICVHQITEFFNTLYVLRTSKINKWRTCNEYFNSMRDRE